MPYKVAGTLKTAIRTFKNPFPFRPNFPFYCPLDSSVINNIDYDLIPEETITNYCEFETEYEIPIFEIAEPADPSTLDPHWNNVVLYLQGNDVDNSTNIIDTSSNPKTITLFGDTKIRTAQSKYGGSSIYFDGNGDGLSLPASNDLSFNADFTIEFWYYHNGTPQSFARLFKQRQGDVWGGLELVFMTSTQIGLFYSTNNSSANIMNDAHRITVALNNWYHIALTNQNNLFRVFVNGGQTYSYNNFPSYDNSSNIGCIGGQPSPSRSINGYIDSLRITKGVARYTGTFNPEVDTYMVTVVQIGTQNTTIFDFAQAP